MSRFFNIAGPCKPEIHYMLSPEDRLPNIRELIDSEAYFVVHAPRQVGKTTCFRELAKTLNQEEKYAAVHLSCETGQSAGSLVENAVEAVICDLKRNAELFLPPELCPPEHDRKIAADSRLQVLLALWASTCPRPVVIFMDEIDALLDESLISVLRQLRSGYSSRPKAFPQSVGLIGLRDVRDYKVRTGVRPNGASLGTSSPFNVKVKSLIIRDFTLSEVVALLSQHEGETGQIFAPGVKEELFRLTQGQPWLVNALARELTQELCRDREQILTLALLELAKENLIERRDTHLDSLIEKLREDRVKRVIEPILAGELMLGDRLDDDNAYVQDLGLVRKGSKGLEIANPIYQEVIPRSLAYIGQYAFPLDPKWYVDTDGRLDAPGLLRAFVEFWQEHAEAMLTTQPYHEVAAQMVFLAWLQRIVNGGGFIDREYAAGSGRIDLLVRWPYQGGLQREVYELKVWRDKKKDPMDKGIEQLCDYLDRLSLDHGTLIVFDQRADALELPERVSITATTHCGKMLTIVRG